MDPIDRIVRVLEEIKLRRGLSGEATEELKYISTVMAKIEQNTSRVAGNSSDGTLLLLILGVLLMILWRVW